MVVKIRQYEKTVTDTPNIVSSTKSELTNKTNHIILTRSNFKEIISLKKLPYLGINLHSRIILTSE